jgi:predicted phosphoribosyltransferase
VIINVVTVALGLYYRDFRQVSDETVTAILAESACKPEDTEVPG